MPIKILHIITHLPVGGAQDNTLLTVERLPRDRYEVHLLYGPEGEWQDRAKAIPSLRCIEMPVLVRPIHLWKDLRALVAMIRLMRRERYAIVHTHSSKPGFLGRLAARLARVPVVVHTIHGFPFHDFMPAWERRFFIVLERWASGLSDKLITVSELNRQKAVSLKLAEPDKFQTLYSGIDFSRFDKAVDRAALRRSLGLNEEDKVIGFVGRLSPQKDPLCLVEAMPRVLEVHPQAQFLMVGDGELRDQVADRAQSLGVTHRLTLLGSREDVPELLQIMDAYVLSSRWEGLGRSLTEALYCGLPVVATAVEGVPELVEDGVTGLLVKPDDAPALARAVCRLLDQPDWAKNLGRTGSDRVRRDFQVGRMVDQIDALYRALLQSKGMPWKAA